MADFRDQDRSLLYDLHKTVNNGLKSSVFDTRAMVQKNTETISRIEDGVQEVDRKLELFIQTRELTCPWAGSRKRKLKDAMQTLIGPVIVGAILLGAQLFIG